MKAGKVILRATIVLLGLALVGLGGFWLWGVASPHPYAACFWAYVGPAILVFVGLAWYDLHVLFRSAEVPHEDVVIAWVSVEIRKKFLGRARAALALLAEDLCRSLSFPALVVRAVRTRTRTNNSRGVLLRVAALEALEGPELVRQLVFLVVGGVAVCLGQNTTDDGSAMAAAWLVTAAPVLQLIAWNIGGKPLPQRLRSQNWNPYLRFVGLACCTGAALGLGFSGLRALSGDVPLSLSFIVQISIDMFRLSFASQLWAGQSLTALDILGGLAGLLYYLTVARSLLRWGDFKRTPNDFAAMALNMTVLGQYNAAVRLLTRVSGDTHDVVMAKSAALLGLNQVAYALETLSSLGGRKKGVLLDPHYLALRLCIRVGLPRRTVLELIDRWLDCNPEPGPFADVLLGLMPVFGCTVDELTRLADDDRIRNHPLRLAGVLLQLGRETDAHTLLADAQSASPEDEVTRLLLLLLTSITRTTSLAEDRANARAWLDVHLRRAMDLSNQCSATQLIFIYQLIAVLHGLLCALGLEREQELAFFRDRVRDRLTSEGDHTIAWFVDELISRNKFPQRPVRPEVQEGA